MSKIGRNAPCPCGSKKKYKKCCSLSGSYEPTPPDFEQFFRKVGLSSEDDPKDNSNKKFNKVRADLEAIFTAHSADDIMITLGVSDLWLPNISSNIKHLFAFGVFASISPDRFNPNSELKDYKAFSNLLERIQKLLPTFPMLEDYIPTADWGEVKSCWRKQLLRLFYGGSLEQVPDFVEAFRLTNAGNPVALDDMHAAILLQDQIISSIDKSLIGNSRNISPGHIEIPSELFWRMCRNGLRQTGLAFSKSTHVSRELILNLGEPEFPKSYSAFTDEVMTGKILQALFIRIGDVLIPLAPRNAVTNIVDFWGQKSQVTSLPKHCSLTEQVSDFLAKRIDHRLMIQGPCWIIGEHKKIHLPFAAILWNKNTIYCVVVLGKENLKSLPKIESELFHLVANSTHWGIQIEGTNRGFQFRSDNKTNTESEKIRILAVLPQEATVTDIIKIPKTRSTHIFPMSDFIAIFDSIENMAEFERFLTYIEENNKNIASAFINLTDKFATFRYSHEVFIDGAIQPDIVMLDPHTGSNWRYEELSRFWSIAPPCFPNDDPSGWKVETGEDGIFLLEAKSQPIRIWSTTISGCTLFFMYRLQPALSELDNRLLELFTHCVTDTIYRGRKHIETAQIFCRRRISVEVKANLETLTSAPENQLKNTPLLQNWEQLSKEKNDLSINIGVSVNIASVLAHFEDPKDDRFECECACSMIDGIATLLAEPLDDGMPLQMRSTAVGKPRFTLMKHQLIIDVPELLRPQKPHPAMLKRARKDIAVIFKEKGVKPGRYELAEAKKLIDIARDAFRDQIHRKIACFKQESVVAYCIAQNDAWIAHWDRTRDRLQHSLKHDVDYDRSQIFAEAQTEFIEQSRNFRFLLECCVSMPSIDSVEPSEDSLLQLIAHVDWLLVLYNASDVLHNGIEAGGIEIDDHFVPRVFYSNQRRDQEKAFSREQANYSLGINLDPDVDALPLNARSKALLDKAFIKDAKITFSHIMDTLSILMQWQSFHGKLEFQLSYRATKTEIATALCSFIDGVNLDEANNLITFLTLYPNQIRKLIGKDTYEGDVPVWEHNKRGTRYTIKPLVPTEDGFLMWGAACAQKARSIWEGNIINGYMPADYDFPLVEKEVRAIKQTLEKNLERQAFEVISKYTPFAVAGLDFKRRFPKEKYEDVGDFDVLAYWPQVGRWLICECKYNQPPFCLKDARRLRERIFGIPPNRGQFSKIERRRNFLSENIDRVCDLLQWPAVPSETQLLIDELYVSREIYWWLRFPPLRGQYTIC